MVYVRSKFRSLNCFVKLVQLEKVMTQLMPAYVVALCLLISFISNANSDDPGKSSTLSALFNVSGDHQHVGIWSANVGEYEVKVEHQGSSSETSGSQGSWNFQVQRDVSTTAVLPSEVQKLVDLARSPGLRYIEDDTDYVQYTGSTAYKLHPYLSSWSDALVTCASEGAHLAVVNSEAEAIYLSNIFKIYPRYTEMRTDINSYCFVGFHQLLNDSFVTIFNEPLQTAGYEEWASGNPDRLKEEKCGGLDSSGHLHDLSCVIPRSFICEKTLPSGQKSSSKVTIGKSTDNNDKLKKRIESGILAKNETESATETEPVPA